MLFLKEKAVLIIVCVVLFIIPFFWMRPGEIDMGGDGGSLYFYDPINVIKNIALYQISPYGTGPIQALYFYLPFVSILSFFKILFGSYILSVLHTSIKLSIGFLATYGIMKALLSQYKEKDTFINGKPSKIEIISILTGIFYIFSPMLTEHDRYVNPLSTHDQVFLNPLLFLLILKFMFTEKFRYLITLLGISLIFSHNFSYTAAPATFSFYPFALLFIILYVLLILKRTLPVKGILIGILFLVFLHLFHLGPEAANLFDPTSNVNIRVFSKEDYKEQVQYFYGVINIASLAKSILLPSISGVPWLFFSTISPLIIILGFLMNKLKSKLFLLTGLFFLLTLFLVSAKISYSGIKLYEMFFLYVPGFGMFRNFYIQWIYAFTFFYALLFGQALYLIYSSFGKTKVKIASFLLFVYLVGSAWLFINGNQFNPIYTGSDNVRRHIIMDPDYERMLEFIRTQPYDGKLLQFPFSDFDHQVVHGLGEGAYIGTTSIGQLTGVKDFAGYWHTVPYSEAFLQLGKEKNYVKLSEIIGLLNIRYIYHNADPKAYEPTFTRPFEYTSTLLPSTQKGLEEFIKPLVGDKLFESGPYRLYLTNEQAYIPHVYVPKKTIVYEYNPKYNKYYHAASSFLIDLDADVEKRVAYVEKNDCKDKSSLEGFCSGERFFSSVPKVFFQKINPVKYLVKVSNIREPFLLVFSDQFHKNWKLFLSDNKISGSPAVQSYFNGDIEEGRSQDIFLNEKTFETLNLKSIPETQHISVNAYANAWYVTPKDIGENKEEATFIIEMTGQRLFYFSLFVSSLAFVGFLLWGFILLVTKRF